VVVVRKMEVRNTIVIACIWHDGYLRQSRVSELAEEAVDFFLGDCRVEGRDV
jgi:hypothetical protein